MGKSGTRSSISIFIFLSLFFYAAKPIQAQVDHWETVINASDTWKYFRGTAEPDTNWRKLSFSDAAWSSGAGGIGFGDGDDGTVIPTTNSVYLRKTFTVLDTSDIYIALLHIDYDDGFIAFLNNVEIARSNLGAVVGDHPPYNQNAVSSHEAEMYAGGAAENFYVSKEKLKTCLLNGSNVLAIQVHNIASSPDLTSNAWFSFGLTVPGSFYGPTPSWFYEVPISSNLPLIHINTNGATIQDDPRVNGTIGITNFGPVIRNYIYDPHNDYAGRIAIEIRGSTSQQYPKKSYGLETQDSLGLNLNVSLLGLPKENDWILYGPYPDKTCMRNELTYKLFREMGHWSPNTVWCELFINNQYLGLYSLVEKVKIDASRLDMPKLDADDLAGDSLTGGYIIKVDKTTGTGPIAWTSPLDPEVYFINHDPEQSLLMTAQRNYIQNYVTSFETALNGPSFTDPVTGYRAYADVNSFMDFMLMQELGRTVDGYRSSTFLHKTVNSYGGKLRMGPMWDFNLSYGNADYCDSYLTAGWQYNFNLICPGYNPHVPFWWDRFLDDPQFRNELRCRWNYLRADMLSTASLTAWVDSSAALLDEAQKRNFKRWPIMGVYVNWNYFVGANYGEEINYLKTWLTNRSAWMDGNLPAYSGTCTSTGAADVGISEINYNSDTLFNSGDWIELYNAGTAAVDISGWRLKDGTASNIFTFPAGTVILPDSFLVICEDTAAFDTVHPTVLNRIGVTNWNWNNGGDGVRLYDGWYTPVFDMVYDNLAPWPLGPDGGGYTLEAVDPFGDGNDPANWFEGCHLGSPGTRYHFPCIITASTPSVEAGRRMSVFPNPFDEITTVYVHPGILSQYSGGLTLSLTDMTGKPVMAAVHPESDQFRLDCSALPSGIYFLSLNNASGALEVEKIVVQ